MEKLYHVISKGLSTKKLTTPFTTDNIPTPTIKVDDDSKFCLIFKGSCLEQKHATYTPWNRIYFFIVYELDTWSRNLNFDFTLNDCSFGGIKISQNCLFT